jgi:hypothetical protein
MDNIFLTSTSRTCAPQRFLGAGVTRRRRSLDRSRPIRHVQAPPASKAYRPLPSLNCTRLLKIEGYNPDICAIYASLQIVNLEEEPAYTALSYTWGNTFKADDDEDGAGHGIGEYESAHAWDLVIVRQKPVMATPGCAEEFTFRDYGECLTNLRITKNLSGFLVHFYDFCFYPQEGEEGTKAPLRRAFKSAGGAALWLDAVCINQDDKAEVRQQILLMGQIYTKATQVVVWLGREVPGLDDFCWMVEKVGGAFDAVHAARGEGAIDFMEQQNPLDDDFWRQHCGLSLRRPSDSWVAYWFHYFYFYNQRRWFQRAWVLQEICLATQGLVMCGTRFLPWKLLMHVDCLLDVYDWRSKFSARLVPAFYRHGMHLSVATISQFYLLQRAIERLREDPSSAPQGWQMFWYGALESLNSQKSTKPEDLAYCILGMADVCFPGVAKRVFQDSIDLMKSPAEAYIWLTAGILKHSTGLDLLGQISIKAERATLGLPSWVPDLADHVSLPSSYPGLVAASTKVGFADNSLTDDSPFYTVNRELFLSGTSLAIIQTSTPDCVYENERWVKSLLLTMLQVLPGDYKHTQQPMMEVLWRTMIMDCHGPNDKIRPASPLFAQFFRAWVTLTAASIYGKTLPEDPTRPDTASLKFNEMTTFWNAYPTEAPKPFPSRAEILEQVTRVAQGDAPRELFDEHIQYESRLRRTMLNRVLFATHEGYLGLGADVCRIGDEVWDISGARVPLILRPVEGGKYVFLGEAYLHGLMGENMGRDQAVGTPRRVCVQ